jgi:hypothetical protein
MRSALAALVLSLIVGTAQHAAAQTTLPTGRGLPVLVKVAVAFVEIASFEENQGFFKGTIDLRLRWDDPRLQRPGEEAKDAPRVYRGAEAQTQLSLMWAPRVELVNQRNDPTYSANGLRIYPSGRVELIRRASGTFTTPFDVSQFPFDVQRLQIELAIRDQTTDTVALEFEQDDLDFSRASAAASLQGWDIRLVNLKSEPLAGWYGASHARVTASLEIKRLPGAVMAAIFIPLFASLLIPFLAIWLNRVNDDGTFKVESFELVNLIVGGLFAVIALNFTVNSLYQVLSTGDNPVHRLFALNYVTLGISLLVNILLFRFALADRLLGRWVQEQLYRYLSWAVPVLVLTMAVSIVLVAFV